MFDKKKAASELAAKLTEELSGLLGDRFGGMSVHVRVKSAVRVAVLVSSPDKSRQLFVDVSYRDATAKEGAAGVLLQLITESSAEWRRGGG